MAGLIPLLLKPASGGSRTSVIFPQSSASSTSSTTQSATQPTSQHEEEQRQANIRKFSPAPLRRIRTDSPARSPSPRRSESPVSSQLLLRRSLSQSRIPRSTSPSTTMADSPRQLAARRLSQQAPLTLPVLPYTTAEWAKAVSEIKRQYLNRRYRPCSVRCSEILDNIKDPSAVEPTYLIYLHFYAASSLEMSARALQHSSPYRTRLLQQARDHYQAAEQLIRNADDAATHQSRPSSAATSVASSSAGSLHSPAGSISSRAWTNSTELTSPSLSIYSLEDMMTPSVAAAAAATKILAPAPSRKRVTFSLSEPVIRPDSPTLGFDDYSLYVRGSPEPAASQTSQESNSTLRDQSASQTPEPVQEQEQEPKVEPDHHHMSSVFTDETDHFASERSVHRYCGLLASLRTELSSHLAEVESQLAAPMTVSKRHSSGRMTPDLAAIAETNDDELRALERRARIECLRQNGWQRKRFDPRRYEELCENALAELD